MATNPVAQVTATPKRSGKAAANQSLNHLLNFTLPPRQTHAPQSLPRRSKKTGTQQGVWNKERFVNAQYRFVMNPQGDYTVHFADPDIFFQWPDILQVLIPRSSALASAGSYESAETEGHTACPICLSTPTAPRMTRCGHVFCFPCILHYLNTSHNLKWIKCPICYDSVNEKQLKSVKWFDGATSLDDESDNPKGEGSSSSSILETCPPTANPSTGFSLRMRLMLRPQITTLALPRSHTWPSDLLPPHQAPFHFLPDVYNFSKFMLATPSSLISNLTKDLDELAQERRTLTSMDDQLGLVFIEAAEQKVRTQIEKANALDTAILRASAERAERDLQELEERHARLQHRRRNGESAHPSPQIPEAFLANQSGVESSTAIPNRNPRQRRNLNPPPPSTSTYYYYQAASGLPLFLHPLDIKILFSHFSSYASFPDAITIRVESYAEGTVNDDLRKRCKYLAHLPEGMDVVFIEADLTDVVGVEGLKPFEGALKSRRSKREVKGRRDDRARARAEEREREKEFEEYKIAAWGANDHVVVPSAMSRRTPSPVEEIFPDPPVLVSSPPPVSGAWGNRSFASALHSNAAPRGRNGTAPRPTLRVEDEDEAWDIDVAFHELERRNAGGNGRGGGRRQQRSGRMVVLGGGGPGGGRRR